MTYAKKTWGTERIFASDLQNMEDGIEAVHDEAVLLSGVKTFADNPKVEKVDAGIDLHDTDAGGVYYIIRSLDGKVEIYDFDATAIALTDILTHAHSGTVGGAKVNHTDLLSVSIDQHHARDHASGHLVGGADALSVGVPSSIGGANVEGSLLNFARRDHIHAHGSDVLSDATRFRFRNLANSAYKGVDALDLYIGGVAVIDSGRDLIGLQQVAQHLVPNGGNTFNLGDATNKWRNLYMDQNIYMDAAQTVDGVDVSKLAAKNFYIQANFDSLFGTPTISNQNNYPILLVATSGNEGFRTSWMVPDDWKTGSSITFTVVWMETTTSTGSVRWQILYNPKADLEDSDTGAITIEVTDGALNNSGIVHKATFTAQGGSNFAAGDTVAFRVTRDGDDASDNYGFDVGLIGVNISYTAG